MVSIYSVNGPHQYVNIQDKGSFTGCLNGQNVMYIFQEPFEGVIKCDSRLYCFQIQSPLTATSNIKDLSFYNLQSNQLILIG